VSGVNVNRQIDWQNGVLRGTLHQGHEDILAMGGEGNSCSAMASTFLAQSLFTTNFREDLRPEHVDELVCLGQINFIDAFLPNANNPNDFIGVDEVQGIIRCLNGASVDVMVGRRGTTGFFEEVGTIGTYKTAQQIIAEFLDWNVPTALVIVDRYIVALVRQGGRVYAYDSHPRGQNPATIWDLEDNVESIYECLHYYCPHERSHFGRYGIQIQEVNFEIVEYPHQPQEEDAAVASSNRQATVEVSLPKFLKFMISLKIMQNLV